MKVVDRTNSGILVMINQAEFTALRSLLQLSKRDNTNISGALETLSCLADIISSIKDG